MFLRRKKKNWWELKGKIPNPVLWARAASVSSVVQMGVSRTETSSSHRRGQHRGAAQESLMPSAPSDCADVIMPVLSTIGNYYFSNF